MLQLQFKNSTKSALWLVDQTYTVGSSLQSDIVVSGYDVQPEHAVLQVRGDEVHLSCRPQSGVWVNGTVVSSSAILRASDVLTVSDTEIQVVDPKKNRRPVYPTDNVTHGWRLRALSAAMASREYTITGTTYIGRSKECDIALSVAHLSRKHAQLTVNKQGLEIIDLNSSNGTFVNGNRVNAIALKDGDEISFDALRFVVVGPKIPVQEKQLNLPEDSENKTVMRGFSGHIAHPQHAVNPNVHPQQPSAVKSVQNKRSDFIAGMGKPSTDYKQQRQANTTVGWIMFGFVVLGLLVFMLLSANVSFS